MTIFKVTFRRVLPYFTWNIIGLFILVAVFYYVVRNTSFLSDSIFLTTVCILTFLFVTPMLFILVVHYAYFRNKTFESDEGQDAVYFSDNANSIKVFKKDIVKINEYNNGNSRVPWNNIYVWEIKTKEKIFKLANIIISKPAFEKLFAGQRIEKKYKFFPTI